MSFSLSRFCSRLPVCCAVAAVLSAVAPAGAAEKEIYAFQGGDDGSGPAASPIMDQAGYLYGTTAQGGGATDCEDSVGCGTVYKIAPDGAETVIHAFAGACDGAIPVASPVLDSVGNMYGTTEGGGTCNSGVGFGTVYEIAGDGTESVLYAFQGGADGEYPVGDLAMDGDGNLYGTASGGNPDGCNGGCGIIFEVTPAGQKSVVYTFLGGNDGYGPIGNVIMDEAGDIYGTTLEGGGTGCGGSGCGTVFKIAPGDTETVLYSFQGGTGGWQPRNGVVEDTSGNLYGTTFGGGTYDFGAVFKVTPGGAESVLYSFQDNTGGSFPDAGVILDRAGNLYGTTYAGGGRRCDRGGCGVVYKLATDGKETVLHSFNAAAHGRHPVAGLFIGPNGFLYGTTAAGGYEDNGVVFRLHK